MLASPTPREQEVLSRFSFQANDVILHTDVSLLPRTEATWSAWNYFVPRDGAFQVTHAICPPCAASMGAA